MNTVTVPEEDDRERALLVCVDTGDYDADTALDELAALADTAGVEVRGRLIQRREAPTAATALGKGRLEELAQLVTADQLDVVIFEGELSPIQLRNLENAVDCRVIDRTMLILDIFARRAQSAEGRLQVELAQLQYWMPRLTGRGTSLSRLGGGVGTRGPGETQLETDRRHLRRRIDSLRRQLDDVDRRRETRRSRRQKEGVQTAALVGYTNAGKSTLMNALTDAGVLAADCLFATLDPTSRSLTLPDGRQILLIDTVGLVQRLPHQLINAFRSTLEEAADADVILNVCDASDPRADEQLAVTEQLLADLHVADHPVLRVLNKCDAAAPAAIDTLRAVGRTAVCISARDRTGLEDLLAAITDALPPDRVTLTVLLPYTQGALAEQCRRDGMVSEEEYSPAGCRMTVTVGRPLAAKLADYSLSGNGQADNGQTDNGADTRA